MKAERAGRYRDKLNLIIPFRRDWLDQKHRQEMTAEEARELFQASRRTLLRRGSQSSSRA